MKKNVYRLLNKVEVDTNEYEAAKLTDLERKRMKKRMKSKIGGRKKARRLRVGGIAVAIMLMFTFGVSSNMITLAKVPIIGALLEDYWWVGDHQSLADYKTVIGESVTDNGVEVTLNEVIVDDGQLLISSTFHTDFSDEDLAYNWFPKIEVFMNGKKSNGGGGGGHEEITNTSLTYFWAADVENVKLEDIQDIKIVFSDLERSDSADLRKGNWSFKFTVSSENLLAERKSIAVEKHFTLKNGQEIIVDNIVLTPVSTTLYYQMLGEAEYEYDVLFIVEDESGKVYDFISASTMGANDHIRFGMIDDDVKKLKITPYLNKAMSDDYEELLDKAFEIELK